MNNFDFTQTAISNICAVVLSVFSIHYFFSCFFERKKINRFLVWGILAAIAAIFWVFQQFITDRFVNMLVLFACTYAISFLNKIKWYNNIFFSLLFYAISSISESIVTLIMIYCFGIQYSAIRHGVFLFSGMLLMICLIFCNHYLFHFIDTIWQSAETDQKLEVADNLLIEQERQYTLLVNNHREISKIHHDYKNMLIGLQADLLGKEYDQALEHVRKELALVSLANAPISGNQIIDTIVNNKITAAKKENIEIDFQFRNLQKIKIDSIDLAILLGNALDNAIEATTRITGHQKKRISLLIVLKDEMLNVIVKNPVDNDIDTDFLDTVKKDKRFHGYGIINMRTIVDRYSGSLIFTCRDLSFATTILLPNIPPPYPANRK
ncbi:MAG: GHKL domain-containing protein [Clostridia bacterium]|nr:GHKL domain-containing protein [Clostridia bacterium]